MLLLIDLQEPLNTIQGFINTAQVAATGRRRSRSFLKGVPEVHQPKRQQDVESHQGIIGVFKNREGSVDDKS